MAETKKRGFFGTVSGRRRAIIPSDLKCGLRLGAEKLDYYHGDCQVCSTLCASMCLVEDLGDLGGLRQDARTPGKLHAIGTTIAGRQDARLWTRM
jgi:hypothetical protein